MKAGRNTGKVPFNPVDLSALTDKYKDVESGEFFGIYVVGWVVIPPNMMKHGGDFCPVSAVDCCNKRGRAQGILCTRVFKNANEQLMTGHISSMQGCEAPLTMNVIISGEKSLLTQGNASSHHISAHVS